MRNGRRKWLWCSAVFTTLAFLAGCGSSGGGAGTSSGGQGKGTGPVRIGVVLPTTGNLASLGNEVLRGYELAQEKINKEGGVWGSQVELVKSDAPDPAAATSAANQLITNQHVSVIAGSYASAISFAASEVAERNKVIYWEQGAVADNITSRGFKYLFRMIYPASELGRAGADFVVQSVAPKLGAEPKNLKVAIVHEDSNNGTAQMDGAAKRFKELGVPVVMREAYSSSTNDMSSIVARVKAQNPDVLMAVAYVNDAILFWRQAQEAGLNVKALVGHGGGHNVPDFAKALGDEVNGVFNAGTSIDFNPKGLKPETQQLYSDFIAAYKAKYNGNPSPHAAMGFNALYVLLKDVLPKAGSMDVEKIREAALSLDKPVGSTIVGWGVKFDPKTQNNTRAFPMVDQWQSQSLKTVWPAEFGVTDKVTVPLPAWGQRKNVGK